MGELSRDRYAVVSFGIAWRSGMAAQGLLETEGVATRQVPVLKAKRLRKAMAHAQRPTGLMPVSSPASTLSGPEQAAIYAMKSYNFLVP